MQTWIFWAVGSTLLFVMVAGCGRKPANPAFVEIPEKLTLYSIDGEHDPYAEPTVEGEMFHGFPVLGKAEIVDPERRRDLIEEFEAGIAKSDGTMNKCFWPRHALRTEKGGTTTDYVICFECLQFQTHQGEQHGTRAIDRSPLVAFNAELKRAGLPLAPSRREIAKL